MTSGAPDSILVIVAGGLGRFVLLMGALTALRSHHPNDRIILLTGPDTVDFATSFSIADDVWSDTEIQPWQFKTCRATRQRSRDAHFGRVYDLDGGVRGRRLFRPIHGWPVRRAKRAALQWCGDIPGTALDFSDTRWDAMHLRDRVELQLTRAGIGMVPSPDLTWIAQRVTSFSVPFDMTVPFVLVATDPSPGAVGSEGWPAEHRATLAETLEDTGLTPVLVGRQPASHIREVIAARVPAAVDLSARAPIDDLVFLAWAAKGAIGCDNGLMHVFAVAGTRIVVLYDTHSDPARTGQRGNDVTILRRGALNKISAGEVTAALLRR